jgi:hypothetical protein
MLELAFKRNDAVRYIRVRRAAAAAVLCWPLLARLHCGGALPAALASRSLLF